MVAKFAVLEVGLVCLLDSDFGYLFALWCVFICWVLSLLCLWLMCWCVCGCLFCCGLLALFVWWFVEYCLVGLILFYLVLWVCFCYWLVCLVWLFCLVLYGIGFVCFVVMIVLLFRYYLLDLD